MPELPEVETIARDFQKTRLIGRTVKKAEIFWPRSIALSDREDFAKQIIGQTFTDVYRRGKFLVFTLTQDTLLVHLRMTGKFSFTTTTDPVMPHERVRLSLDDGRILRYEDQRKFGRWFLTRRPEKILGALGLEPLSPSFTIVAFNNVLKSHSSMRLKTFLLNQNFIAGLGNIYVDEALWEAKLHPLRHVSSLSRQEVSLLHLAIRTVLEKGIENMGTSLGSKNANYYSVSGRRGNHQQHLNVFRRDGMACPRCGEKVQKMRVSQRGTHLCIKCQK